MIRPRPYLSFSQMATYEMSPEKYVSHYIYNAKQRISRNMAYGSMVADTLEEEGDTGDALLDLMLTRVPKLSRMDKVVEDKGGIQVYYEIYKRKIYVPALENGMDDIPLLAKPDTANRNYTAFKEYKTSTRPWTQKMVDESGQVTFYATAIWVKTGHIPKDIELIVMVVDYDENSQLRPTGALVRYPTQRTMVDIIKMSSRIKHTWEGIGKLCENELL